MARILQGDDARHHALRFVFELFTNDELQQLVDGEEVPIEALRAMARAVLHLRRLADKAPEN